MSRCIVVKPQSNKGKEFKRIQRERTKNDNSSVSRLLKIKKYKTEDSNNLPSTERKVLLT